MSDTSAFIISDMFGNQFFGFVFSTVWLRKKSCAARFFRFLNSMVTCFFIIFWKLFFVFTFSTLSWQKMNWNLNLCLFSRCCRDSKIVFFWLFSRFLFLSQFCIFTIFVENLLKSVTFQDFRMIWIFSFFKNLTRFLFFKSEHNYSFFFFFFITNWILIVFFFSFSRHSFLFTVSGAGFACRASVSHRALVITGEFLLRNAVILKKKYPCQNLDSKLQSFCCKNVLIKYYIFLSMKALNNDGLCWEM